MPAHLLSPERRTARLVGALAIALGCALLVVALTSEKAGDHGRTALSGDTTPTVLGEVIESTTLPDAPPASAAELTTTSTDEGGDDDGGTTGEVPIATSPPTTSPPPTIGPPVSVTRPPRPTTTTTTPPPVPQCSDLEDNDGDGLTDSDDPGCHSDRDATNPDSFEPSDDDETDSPPVTAGSG